MTKKLVLSDGNVKIKDKSEEKEYLHNKLNLDTRRSKLLIWVYAIMTFVIGDIVTTYIGTQVYGLSELNLIIAMAGLPSNPIAFLKFKIVILGVIASLIIIQSKFLKMARLERTRVYFYYLSVILVGTLGLIVVRNNIIAISSV